MDFTKMMERISEALKIVPDVIALYKDLEADKTLNSSENLERIVEFARTKVDLLEKYVAPNEVTMLVCGVLGVLHEGDSSQLYLKLLEAEANSQPTEEQ